VNDSPAQPSFFSDSSAQNAGAFEASLRAFDAFGAKTQSFVEAGVPYLVNEFWTAGQRQAHALHEISYRACFKPQLPAFFIERLTRPGDAVYDPFMGRGTTAIEAALHGRRPFGSDVNPLSALLTRPRLAPPSVDAVARRLSQIPFAQSEIEREDLQVFYHPATLRQICALRAYLRNAKRDGVDDWIAMVALNRLTGHSPGFFSVYTLPPNQAVSIEAQRKINEKRRQTPPPRDVAALIIKKTRALLKDGAPPENVPRLDVCDARHAHFIRDGEIALIVTSPPFLDVVQYDADNWLRNWFAEIDTKAIQISQHRSAEDWERMVRACFVEFARIVAPGGYVAFEVGEVRGGKVLLERLVWRALEGLPFARMFVLVNQQNFTKTSNCWGVGNNAKGTNSNRIVLARRL
jgi:hypothetical protein